MLILTIIAIISRVELSGEGVRSRPWILYLSQSLNTIECDWIPKKYKYNIKKNARILHF